MPSFTSHFKFTKQQRGGIFFLLFLIVLAQCVYFFADFSGGKKYEYHPQGWEAFQQTIDSIKKSKVAATKPGIRPFNPNYLSDYQGYALGMSTQEIDKLIAYRNSGKFVNSAREFQQVTGISDSLLSTLSPYFKFPAWVVAKQSAKNTPEAIPASPAIQAVKKDLNTVTAEELKTINGIGEALSERIVKFRNRLGGFLVDEQLYDVYGLSAPVVKSVLESYTVLTPPKIQKLNLNTASAKELASIIYIPYKVTAAIIAYRDSVGSIRSVEELTKIKGFPADKINRIQLYLKAE
jgi:competence ComEA-like helix-hairpin-helix protein